MYECYDSGNTGNVNPTNKSAGINALISGELISFAGKHAIMKNCTGVRRMVDMLSKIPLPDIF